MVISPSPVLSILEAVLTVSPNRQYLGIFKPTTPATHGPVNKRQSSVSIVSCCLEALGRKFRMVQFGRNPKSRLIFVNR